LDKPVAAHGRCGRRQTTLQIPNGKSNLRFATDSTSVVNRIILDISSRWTTPAVKSADPPAPGTFVILLVAPIRRVA